MRVRYFISGITGFLRFPAFAEPTIARVSVPLLLLCGSIALAGESNPPPDAAFSTGNQFIPVTPCRVADTRNPIGPFGGPEPLADSVTTFNIPQSACNIPGTAVAYSLNVTVVPDGPLNYLTMWPSGEVQPNVSTLNSDGRIKANAAIVPAGSDGGVSIFVTDSTQVILDIDGYFVPAGTSSALDFYPVMPCRIADTRNAAGPLGGPFISAGGSRNFPVQSSNCNLPSAAEAYSLNITAVPHKTLNYLTTWPTGGAQPNVSTLNSSTGAVTANAAIVPAGAGGDLSVFVHDEADVILDVNGYFAPPTAGGLSLYISAPCRVIDTRPVSFQGTATVSVQESACAVPSTAEAYVLNATVVPQGALNFLTLWSAEATQPNVSTLNADDGAITSNMAILPTSNGSVDAFADGTTNLILDISSYFALTSISIVPGSANVAAGGTIQFTATGVAGPIWKVNGVAGGDTTSGTISTNGLYAAPQAAGSVTISADDPSDAATSAQASVSILAPHQFGTRSTSGMAQFYDRANGNAFTPRGNSYVRLATLTDPDGSSDYTHSTFSVGLYDSAQAEAALTSMQASGYNVVRVFLWGCCSGTIGDPAGGISSAYIQNVVDFLRRAKAHSIGAIFSSQWLPAYGGYTDALGNCYPQFDDINLTNLSSCGLIATKKFFHDYVQALVNAGAPMDAIFAYDLWSEYYYNSIAAPLSNTSGIVTAANGQTYDMSSATSKQQMMDDGLVYYADQNRSAILAIDPTALVTISFFVPEGPNPTRLGDFRIIEVYPAIASSTLDYVDLHLYPIAWDLTMDQLVQNFGFVGYQQQKPIVMGEFGAFIADYPSVTDAAAGMQDWQVQSCAYNFQGWMLWTWDTDEQTDLWNALSQGGVMNQSLSPATRPNPCTP